jgi:hypothetical protein
MDTFQKLRVPVGKSHPILADRRCVAIGIDPENDAVVYLIPKEDFEALGAAVPELIDPRRVTAEEVFLYYARCADEEKLAS